MFKSIGDFDKAFMSLFHGIVLPINGSNVNVFYRYYKKSSENYVEEDEEQKYPCIALQDYAPKIKEGWFIDLREELGELNKEEFTRKMYKRPAFLTFNYDVSICAKGYNHHTALKNLFTQQYINNTALILNKVDLGIDGVVGDVVPMEVTVMDIPRTDGVLETNYNFKLDAWIHIQEPRDVDVVGNLIINVNPTE